MEETTNQNQNQENSGFFDQEESLINIQNLLSLFILNWKWFVFSIIVFVGAAYGYLRYTTPVFQASSKMMIKDDNGGGARRQSLRTAANLDVVSTSEGIDNEMEIIASRSIAQDVVTRLKLYTTYTMKGKIVDRQVYKTQPITVEIEDKDLKELKYPISLTIVNNGGKYSVTGNYTIPGKGDKPSEARQINKTLPAIPTRLNTSVGNLSFYNNENGGKLGNGETMYVSILPADMATAGYVGRLSVQQLSKTTSIARMTFTDINVERAKDYLRQIVISYNDAANYDKNVVAARTEDFINKRLEKINAELGLTEGQIESFKRSHGVVDVNMTANNAYSQSNNYDQQLVDMGTQVELLNEISKFMNDPQNKNQPLPFNVGLSDQAASALISNYNQIAMERTRLLRTANENSPTVIPMTEQLNELSASIRRAIAQTRSNYQIKRNAMMNQYSKYNAQVQQSPVQERILNQIGRQQEVRSGLYLMLLQKREENSISLAATADKGKQIDEPAYAGQISPNPNMIYLSALGVSIVLPFLILLLLQLMRYKIEGRADVERLTKMPVLADIPVASENAKTKADIVVHENRNNMMEEVFRSLRTNIQFSLKEDEKTILVTSSTSGEGKTFIAANIAVSFALLGKKVVLVGLDIRKPRLAELFGINDKDSGITRLLTLDNPTPEQVQAQIVNSEINADLDLLMAGPIPPNPAEIVTRESLDNVFDILKDKYDYIIVDTAPVGLVTDTIGISRVANMTVFVCRADYTPKTAFAFFNELGSTGKMPNPTIAINAVDLSKKKYGYYYGYGKYGRYGKYANYRSYNSYGSRYGSYGRYGRYGGYGSYGTYGQYGSYSQSHYGNADDDSIKK